MKDLEWRHLKGLYQVYTTGQTRLKLANNQYVNQILIKQKRLLKFKSGNHDILEKTNGFDQYFEKELLKSYAYFETFFTNSGIESDARKTFSEDDIKTLLFIYNNKNELKKSLTTEYTFSANVFKKGSKYLTNKPSLKNAVLHLLAIDQFPEKDPKNNLWRLVVDCPNPRAIVLCENLACLRVPFQYKENGIELWYVGGNNTAPLNDISEEKFALPIYYFCDWDYNGLAIYSRIKKILHEKEIQIKILQPLSLDQALPVQMQHHDSKWKNKPFSGLNINDFNQEQIEIINKLIISDAWIEEESMDLLELLGIPSE